MSAPTFFEIDMSLSFRITRKSLSEAPALFKPSKAIPPVIPPSPMTAMALFGDFLSLKASLIPNAAEIDVLE